MMPLSEKGRFAPPPRIAGRGQEVALSLAAWPHVHSRTHWLLGNEEVVDGADFYVGGEELGHLHLDGTAHIAVGEELAAAIVEARLARRFHYSDAFVVFEVRTEDDVPHVLWLFELRYHAILGLPVEELIARIREAVG